MVCMEIGLKILVLSAEVTLKPLQKEKKKTKIKALTVKSNKKKKES